MVNGCARPGDKRRVEPGQTTLMELIECRCTMRRACAGKLSPSRRLHAERDPLEDNACETARVYRQLRNDQWAPPALGRFGRCLLSRAAKQAPSTIGDENLGQDAGKRTEAGLHRWPRILRSPLDLAAFHHRQSLQDGARKPDCPSEDAQICLAVGMS